MRKLDAPASNILPLALSTDGAMALLSNDSSSLSMHDACTPQLRIKPKLSRSCASYSAFKLGLTFRALPRAPHRQSRFLLQIESECSGYHDSTSRLTRSIILQCMPLYARQPKERGCEMKSVNTCRLMAVIFINTAATQIRTAKTCLVLDPQHFLNDALFD